MCETKYKILMVAMNMGFGGAETHVYELARHLHSNGFEIALISNGGVFAGELEREGIRHINAPLNSRSISSMLKAKKIIRKTVKEYRPDIVHSHARIPSFLCASVCRKLKVPLVTTVHGTFSLAFPLKHLTNWGDYALAVSDDIKAYLVDNYKFPKVKIISTVNAVNDALFSPNKENKTIRKEFNIKDNEKIILNVSRLDKTFSSLTAFKLCAIAEKLHAFDGDTRIVIVGGGEVYEEVKAAAKEVNKKIGREYIIMAGGRSDIYNFTQAADIFAGISRAALEAMSSGTPTVLCGDMGWLGRFCETNVNDCVSTNFTCRGFGYPENLEEHLFSDIKFVLDPANREEVEKSSKMGIELVKSSYSVARMGADARSAYKKAMNVYKPYDCVISGYYGHYNAGDDTLLFAILNNILREREDLKFCVLASQPKKLKKRIDCYFAGIDVKHRFNFLGLRKTMKNAKMFLFGGGTLIQDNTSTKSLLYYLYLLNTADRLGLKTFLYANGLNITNDKNTKIVRKVIKKVSFSTLRDKNSYDFMQSLGADMSKAALTADEAMTLKDCNLFDVKNDFLKDNPKRKLCICVRKWKYAKNVFFSEFLMSVNIICKKYDLIPVYVTIDPKNDREITENLAECGKHTQVIEYDGDISRILSVINSCDFVISMRLHALIFALILDKPLLAVSYDKKVRNTITDFFGKDDYTIDLEHFNQDVFVSMFNGIFSREQAIIEEIRTAKSEISASAKQNAKIFIREFN